MVRFARLMHRRVRDQIDTRVPQLIAELVPTSS
jgi:hypothetical protein